MKELLNLKLLPLFSVGSSEIYPSFINSSCIYFYRKWAVYAAEHSSALLVILEVIQYVVVTEGRTAVVALFSLQSAMGTESEWHIREAVKVRMIWS